MGPPATVAPFLRRSLTVAAPMGNAVRTGSAKQGPKGTRAFCAGAFNGAVDLGISRNNEHVAPFG
jgi:hypothetical protein